MIYLAVICGLELAGTFLIVKVLLDERGRVEQAWSRERADLLQRIQAPEHAAIQHYNDHVENFSPPAVNPEIDEDHWIGKDDLAEVMARDEVNSGD